jgi:hypothetical protein
MSSPLVVGEAGAASQQPFVAERKRVGESGPNRKETLQMSVPTVTVLETLTPCNAVLPHAASLGPQEMKASTI